MKIKGQVYTLPLRDLKSDVKFYLHDDYNFQIANEIKQNDSNILCEPIRLININKRGGKKGAFLDIGANIGQYSMVFAAYGYKVFGFDANPINIEQLRNSADTNGFNAEFIFAAVTEKSGICRFNSVGPWGTLLDDVSPPPAPYDTIEVNGIALDDWYISTGKPNISVIKMDIEGAELLALQGMKNLLEENDYPLILTEFNIGFTPHNGKTHNDFLSAFADYGYHPYTLKHKETLYRHDINNRFGYVAIENYIMLRDEDPILKDYNVLSFPIKSPKDFLDDAIFSHDVYKYGYAYTVLCEKELLAEKESVLLLIDAIRSHNLDPSAQKLLAEIESRMAENGLKE